jgi:cytochrome oxidase assembly protein ShyY1
MRERTRRCVVGLLVVVVLLLVIMPAMLYLVGWSVHRATNKSKAWINFPAIRKETTEKPAAESPARTKA